MPSPIRLGLISAFLTGDEFSIFGNGRQSRDFTYVDDAVSATLLAMEIGVPGALYNVDGGSEVSVLEAVHPSGVGGRGADRHAFGGVRSR
jgi:nucleoside-diphosphate-sugar epimerase